MSSKTNLELALRITADLKQAIKELAGVKDAITNTAAATEKAEKSTTANTAATEKAQKANAANAINWQRAANAQNAAMQAATRATTVTHQQAQAAEKAAQAAAKATVDIKKEDQALQQLFNALDKTERGLSKLDKGQAALTAQFNRGKIAADDYARYMDKINQKRTALTATASDAKAANKELAAIADTAKSLRNVLVTGIAGASVLGLAKDVIQTNLAWQQATYTMSAATDTAQDAAAELDFVREISERLGLELISTSQAYARLVASAKEAPQLKASIQAIFEGVATAGTALHLAPAEMQGILLAMEQMVSKGKVQTQELVLQLGQRIPGAFSMAAKASGLSTAQLSKALEQGTIKAEAFLPRFAAALQDAYGPASQGAASGLQAELNRLENAFTELKIRAGEAGFIDDYTAAIKGLTTQLKDPATAQGFSDLTKGLGTATRWAVEGLSLTAGAIRHAAESAAARVVGPLLDDLPRVEDELDKYTAALTRNQLAYDNAVKKGNEAEQARLLTIMDGIQQKIGIYRQAINDFGKVVGNAPSKPKADSDKNNPDKNDPITTTKTKVDKQLEFVKSLEKEAATYGKVGETLRAFNIEQQHLTGSYLERANAANSAITAAEKQAEIDKEKIESDKQQAEDVKTLAQIQIEYWRATGQEATATMAEIDQKYGELRQRMLEGGYTHDVKLIDDLKKAEDFKVRIGQAQSTINAELDKQSALEQSINVQREAGNMSEFTARQQIYDLHQATAAKLLEQRPLLEELSRAPAEIGAQGKAALQQLDAEVQRLHSTMTLLESTFRQGLTTGISTALQGLANGTMNLHAALVAMNRAVADALINMAAQALAEQAVAGLFQSGSEGAGLTAGASAVTTSAGALSAAGGTLITGAGALSAAAGALAGASAASAGSSMVGTISTGASVAAFAATGGYITGPGTTTSDSIPTMLSNKEFVARAAVVTQPGALDFLTDFNQRGMAALGDWAPVAHATGGLAGVPAPAMPHPGKNAQPALPAAVNQQLARNLHFNLLDDPKRIVDVLNTPAGEEVITVMISRDPAKFRAILGV